MEKNNDSREVPGGLKRYARLLDNQFRLGNSNFRFGLDPILGLIPGVGDFLSMLMSGGFIALAAKKGASGKLLILMSLNVFIDAVVGSIPIIGAIFDFLYKANERNVRLLEKHYKQGKYGGSGKGLAIVIIIILLVLSALVIYLLWKLFKWIFTELNV